MRTESQDEVKRNNSLGEKAMEEMPSDGGELRANSWPVAIGLNNYFAKFLEI